MAVNKVEFGDQVVMDITDSTVSPEKLLSGETAYDKSGAKITGSLVTKDITVTPKRDTGENIATVTIDGIDHDIYALSEEEVADFLSGDQEAEGNPVTLNTLIGGNAKSCSIDLEPIQDLHGYDHPWPGGAGKNKLQNNGVSKTENGVTFTVNSDGSVTINTESGGATNNTNFLIGAFIGIDGTQYAMNGIPSGLSSINMTAGNLGATDTGNGASFTYDSTKTDKNVRIWCLTGFTATTPITVKPMIRLSSVIDGTFAPYENNCPISGRVSVEVKRTGKNRLENTATSITNNGITYTVNSDGTVDADGTATANSSFYINANSVKYFGNTVFNGCPSGGTSTTYFMEYYDIDVPIGYRDYGNGVTIPAETNGHTCRTVILIRNGTTVNHLKFKPMIRPSSITDDTYEPCQGLTVTIQFGQAVYSGKLNFINGKWKLTINKGFIKYDETAHWIASTNNRYATEKESGMKSYDTSAKSNSFKAYSSATTVQDGGFYIGAVNIGFKIDSIQTLEDWTAFVAEKNIQVCYTLETPIEITLTAEQISLLKGINVLSTDGDNIDITWQNIPDIEKLIGNTIEGILTAGSTSLTLQSNKITEDSTLDIYTDKYGVNPTDITVTNGQAVLAFESQSTDLKVKVKVM